MNLSFQEQLVLWSVKHKRAIPTVSARRPTPPVTVFLYTDLEDVAKDGVATLWRNHAPILDRQGKASKPRWVAHKVPNKELHEHAWMGQALMGMSPYHAWNLC